MAVPAAPTPLGIDQITPSSVRYQFTGNSSGGLPILEWEIAYGTDPISPSRTIGSFGSTVIEGLTPNTEWFFWSRGRNADGWGPWSIRFSTVTMPGLYVKVDGVWRRAVAYVKADGVWRVAQPFVKSSGVWKKSG